MKPLLPEPPPELLPPLELPLLLPLPEPSELLPLPLPLPPVPRVQTLAVAEMPTVAPSAGELASAMKPPVRWLWMV